MTRPPDERMGTEVQGWLGEVGEAPPGDFCDVLRRTQGLGGGPLSAQDIEDVSRFPADEDELRARLNFGTLDDFLDAAAAFVAEQAAEDPPPMRAAVSRRRGWAWVGASTAVVAAAAAAFGWWGLPNEALVPRENDAAVAAAADRSHTNAEGQAAEQRPVLRRSDPPTPAPDLEPAQVDAPQAAPEVPNVPDFPPSEAPRTQERASIEALDAQAREAWRSGELNRARRLFERVVSRGRAGERADVAYGDLFTLARRQGDDAALRRYWKRYVKRFPKGRYIDDARAGLCRAAGGDARTRCWERYLEARPRGTYREDAEAALRVP